MSVDITVVIPAHNEENTICRCLDSIRQAADAFDGSVEVIVVCNRCTDRTAALAEGGGARVVVNDERCIASVRNAGIRAARGEIIATIDADNRMTPGTLAEIDRLLGSGRFIGGGAPMRFERYSLPLWLNDMLCRISFRLTGLYSGIIWARKASFEAIGGFVKQKAMEDAATAKRLKALGRQCGQRYTTLGENHLINSTRKFDDMGDWLYLKLLVKNARAFLRAARGDASGIDRLLDELFYDYNDR